MKQVEETKMRDVKASIALGVAEILDPAERVEAVCAILKVDDIEARLLISRGRRIRRMKRESADA